MLFEYTPNPDSTKPGSVRWGILEGPTFTGAEEDLITGPYLDGVKVLPGRIIQIRVFEVKRLATRGIEME